MPIDPKSHARAAMLSASLMATPLPEAELVRRIEVAPIKRVVRRERPPLDLDAAIYRYFIESDGSVRAVNEPAGARACRRPHRHR